MAKHYKLTMVALSVLSTLAYAEETLEQINIEYKIPPKQDVFKKAEAVSVRDNISTATQSIDDIIRSVPGAFTNLDKSSGAISVNLRGQTGFGRVDTMIDGVSQTFFATSGDNSKKSGGTSQFGAQIDPAFIASVDIHRGSGGQNGSNALIGSANFRTIGVDDVLNEGQNVGVMLNSGGGTNSIGPNYMVALAGKYALSDTATIGAMYAYSWRKISQDFKVGGGVNIRDVDKEDVRILAKKSCTGMAFPSDCVTNAIERYERQPYDPSQLTQHPKSHLAKLEFKDEKNQAVLSFRSLSTALSGRNLDNRNYQLNYTYTPKENLHFNAILADNTSKQNYQKGAFYNSKALTDVLISKNKSQTLNLNVNFSTPLSEKLTYEVTLGSNFLVNEYSKNRHPRELAYNFAHGEPNSIADCPPRPYGLYNDDDESKGWLVCDYHSTKSNTFQPDGKQRFRTFYLDQTLTYDIYTLRANVNRQFYKYSGTTFHRNKYYQDSWKKTDMKYHNADVWTNSTSEDFVNKYGAEYLLNNHIEHCYSEFGKYKSDFRKSYVDIYCPLQDYERKRGGSRTHTNYSFSLYADFHPLFSPFVTYSKTHRVPNIKEMYFSEIGDLAVRTDLKSEKAKTVQFGINGHKEGIFSDWDMLGFKVLAYQTKIHDYILNAKRECNGYNINDCFPHITHFNYAGGMTKFKGNGTQGNTSVPLDGNGVVTLKGIELEVNYDIGWFYVNLAYARQKSNQPSSFSDSSAKVNAISSSGVYLQGFGLSKVSVLPKDYASLDIGTRLFDGKLTLGTIAKYYGKFKRAQLDKSEGDVIVSDVYKPKGMKVNGWMRISGTEEVKAQPMIFDFYAIFQPTENLTIKGEIQNAFDKKYINPLDANNDSASQSQFIMGEDLGQMTTLNNYSRGRTFVLNVNYRF
ncbi:TonB-dependent receptor [Actinobacillus seminis]|uniref:Putative outer membrane colicin Js receptor n=1 Tax=Actinobacillus seminis TaxID=722 RepID=A0A263HCT7_9PAST|nr:TonB-dependent receptor [Actinobacillus seminis]OZN24729.1 TonB-dependent receptor [Actinobacillus seminis]SUU35071.1 putative outer membrane colicin Js receptor [Actinobacillus seminis]